MKKFELKWNKIEKFGTAIERTTVVQALTAADAKAVLHKEFGNSKKIEVLSVKELKES